jgi:FkbM family methyltransferase
MSHGLRALRWHLVGRWSATPAKRAEWALISAARRLGPGDIAIDCGANVGKYTELLAASGASVHAFEPDPYCLDVLRRKFAGRGNIAIHAAAAGAAEGDVKLYRTRDFAKDPRVQSQGSSLHASKSNVDAGQFVTVRQVDLSAFVRALPGRVAIMKMDIEGAEVDVIERLLATGAADRIDALYAETHEAKIPALAERTAALRRDIAARGLKQFNLDWK